VGVLGQEREKGIENLFNEVIAVNFANPGKYMHPHLGSSNDS
jgi:hypothetical protein